MKCIGLDNLQMNKINDWELAFFSYFKFDIQISKHLCNELRIEEKKLYVGTNTKFKDNWMDKLCKGHLSSHK